MSTSRGFLTFAQNTNREMKPEDDFKTHIDYLRHAYALALSIKISQKNNNFAVAITPGQEVPETYRRVFDHIIEIPWGDLAEPHKQKFHNEWKAVHITPFDNTIKIESDMLLTQSIDHWWDFLEDKDLLFTSKVYDYREEVIESRNCRRHFDTNDLPDIYNGLMFFKKNNPTSYKFFKMAEAIMKDWDNFSYEFLDFKRPKILDTDTAYALALVLTNLEDKAIDQSLDFPTFVHMKTELQKWRTNFTSEYWIDNVSISMNEDIELKIANYKQTYPFHYQEKAFLSDVIIKKLEDRYERI